MFNIREMKPEDKAVIMPMVITFYHSPAVEHDVDTAVLERTFDAATDPTMPYISGLVMLEDEKVVGYGYVTGYYASEVGGMCMFMEEMYFTPECRVRHKSLSLDCGSLSGIQALQNRSHRK